MTLILILQLLVFVHYFFILGNKVIFPVITAQDLLCSIAQFLLCYIYCKRTSRLIENHKQMITVLQIVGVISITVYVVIISMSSIKNHQDGANGIYSSCKTKHYLILNTLQSSVLVLFCVVGCVILSRINSYTP